MGRDFLRLGVACAVIDDQGRILLSKRGDLDVWNLPTGRLDAGEDLRHAAAREVEEETGVLVEIDEPVGLYHSSGWGRMNVLYRAHPTGGRLIQQTDETRANQFFAADTLPRNLYGDFMIQDVLADKPNLYLIQTPAHERRRIKRKLALRWVINLLSGHPEPRYPHFDVWAVLMIWDAEMRRVCAVPAGNLLSLPRVLCDGNSALWQQGDAFAAQIGVHDVSPVRWVGVWQNPAQDTLEFVFCMTSASTHEGDVLWHNARNAGLTGLDRAYLEQTMQNPDRTWSLVENQHSFESINIG